MQDALFYVGQKAIINKSEKILLLHDPVIDKGSPLDFPGGKLQEGELNFEKALLREITEETQLKIKVGRPFFTSYYQFSNNKTHVNANKKIFLVIYDCQYLSGKIKLSSEHDDYIWVDKNDYKNIIMKNTNVFEIIKYYFSMKNK